MINNISLVDMLNYNERTKVFFHPSKFNYNNYFKKLEFIGDSYIERAIKHYIFDDYPLEGVDYYNKLLNLFVSNDSLSIVSLEQRLNYGLQYCGNLTINLLADTYEALIGCVAITKNPSKIEILNHFIYNTVYLIDDDSDYLVYLYSYYLKKLKYIAKIKKLYPIKFYYEKNTDIKDHYYVSTLQIGVKKFKGISRTLRRSRLISMLKFIQSLNISLDFKNLLNIKNLH